MRLIDKICHIVTVPVSPKYLRISTLLIAIYKVLVAHILLFIMLLGLAHAEEMSAILGADIADQKEREEYIYVPTNAKGETMNQLRFKTAANLASVTLCMLYIGTTLATIYVLSCLGLLIGTLRNRHELFIPWMVVDFFGTLICASIMIAVGYNKMAYQLVGKWQYWGFCFVMTSFNLVIWSVVRLFYKNLAHMTKLREVAVVAIPCPAPGSVIPKNCSAAAPYHYRKENMHLSDGGLKHILFDANEANYLV
ncbi:uncharacterized protein LOC129755820 [Uranotaenia lowii]|uniref:uncharacterized protein LOC129755820 n=1 Tax=Uranotaenia lowii TaxID=190385 RepID=UPI0024795A3D|nr:uncharacterized protein LOC129755820 [Uranotaenia lowii]XP_055608471.1 uncharacterized protein LOC129755820 [Uranotaenia lowii]